METAHYRRRHNIMDEIMAEPVRMPGFPQLIVTRAFAWDWLAELGYRPNERGFGSMDYMVFGKPPVELPMTDLEAVTRIRQAFNDSGRAGAASRDNGG